MFYKILLTLKILSFQMISYGMLGATVETFTGVVYSPLFKHYAVIGHLPSDGNILVPKRNHFLRVFSSDGHNELWMSTAFLGRVSDIHLADDGVHLVVVKKRIDTDLMPGHDSDEDVSKEIEESHFLTFYRKNEVLKKYSVTDVGLRSGDVQLLHNSFTAISLKRQSVDFLTPLERIQFTQNPVIIDQFMKLKLSNNKFIYFNIQTGKLLDKPPEIFRK